MTLIYIRFKSSSSHPDTLSPSPSPSPSLVRMKHVNEGYPHPPHTHKKQSHFFFPVNFFSSMNIRGKNRIMQSVCFAQHVPTISKVRLCASLKTVRFAGRSSRFVFHHQKHILVWRWGWGCADRFSRFSRFSRFRYWKFHRNFDNFSKDSINSATHCFADAIACEAS